LPQTAALPAEYVFEIQGRANGLQSNVAGHEDLWAAPYPDCLPYGTTTRNSVYSDVEQLPEDALPASAGPTTLKELFTVTPLDRTSLSLREPHTEAGRYPVQRLDMGPIERAAAITKSRIRLPSLVAYSMPDGYSIHSKPAQFAAPRLRQGSDLALALPRVQGRQSPSTVLSDSQSHQTFTQISMVNGKFRPPRGYQRAASRRSMHVVREDETESEQSTSDQSAELCASSDSRYLRALSQRRIGRSAQRGPRGPR